jgi:hypothetical protein
MMGRVLAYLLRFALILVGYVAAVLAASAFIHLLFLGSAGFLEEDVRPVAGAAMLFSVPFVALFVAYFVFVPSVIAIGLAELLGRRDWLSYALFGAAIGIAFIATASGNVDGGYDLTRTPVALGIVGGGMVGGIAYWLTAGRWAGSWRSAPPPQVPTSPEP